MKQKSYFEDSSYRTKISSGYDSQKNFMSAQIHYLYSEKDVSLKWSDRMVYVALIRCDSR